MLAQPTHHLTPFPFFHVTSAFSAEQCAMLESLFVIDAAWQHRDGAFYRCSLRDVTSEIPAAFLTEVLERMREITGLPLVEQILVTAQQMQPGQVIGIHSDRPLLGYECLRLVVQLNKHWQAEHGGVLELFASAESGAVLHVPPHYNEAFGFVLHVDSYHAVTEVTQARLSLVFNFWHAANTSELAEHVQTLFAGLHFSELPTALNPIAAAAESSLPEDTTFRAGTAAVALKRWGYEDATVIAGYCYSAGMDSSDVLDAETHAAIRLADWVARLYRDCFDLKQWQRLRSELAGIDAYPRLLRTCQLCLLMNCD